MKWLFIFPICFYLAACGEAGNNPEEKKPIQSSSDTAKPKDYFPVTDFILGDIHNIREKGINPVKVAGSDSSWIKIEDLEKEMAEFLTPVIGKGNLVSLFEETSFMDQTTNSFTFTYDPRGPLPDSISLRHWDVYVDPAKNKVWRIYLLKEMAGQRIQLTWEPGKRCSMVRFSKVANGEWGDPSETTYFWDY